MTERDKIDLIGKNLFRFQAALKQSGTSLQKYLEKYYYEKWMSDQLCAALSIRTTLVNSMHHFLAKEGLLNLEKLQLSPLTDPLRHDVEHVPSISYKGQLYVTTHSMIYAKFLACHNPKIKGIYVDSPNIRLEMEDIDRKQRGKYLIDFSQMDIEVRRNRGIDLETYLNEPKRVEEILAEDFKKAIDFFERLVIYVLSELVENNEDDLKALGIAIEVPKQPFPRFRNDESMEKYGPAYEIMLGEEIKEQCFWITGIFRENYDLVYPYLKVGGKTPLSEINSANIYNYDICIKSIIRDSNKQTPALEVLSGGIREWLYETIVERLLDNGIIPERPVISNGNISNIDALGGYGPFLMIASMKNKQGRHTFPDTFGAGIGVERTLYALCRGPKVSKIDDVTCFGKNPDSHQIYLF